MQNNTHPRCLYKATLSQFLDANATEIFGYIVSSFHGIDQTTTNEAWMSEIEILQNVLCPWRDEDAYVFFEYDIPRLGKRVDVVLLFSSCVTQIASDPIFDQSV